MDIKVNNSFIDEFGMVHYQFKLEVDGVEIYDSWGSAHYDENGELSHFIEAFSSEIPEETKPRLSKNEALEKAEEVLPLLVPPTTDNILSKIHKDAMLKLVFFRPPGDTTYTLVYQVDLRSTDLPTHQTIFVNSKNGIIVHISNNINGGTGTAVTAYNESQYIKTTYRGWWFNYNYLRNTENDTPIETRNSYIANQYYCYPGNWNSMDKVYDYDNNWIIDGAYNAASAHWAVSEAYNVYKTFYGRDYGTYSSSSSNNEIRVVNNFLGFASDGYPSNAYTAVGDLDYIYAGYLYGQSDRNGFSGSLDAMGHEFTHGVIGRTHGVYELADNDAGAIAESFCDIFGEVVEYYTTGSTDYCLGSELDSEIRRSFVNPSAFPRYEMLISIDEYCFASASYSFMSDYPVVRGDANWIPNGDRYLNSMISSRWFYLLANGGTQNNVTVNGIGIEKAAKIAYRNMTVYYNYSTSYDAIRNGAITSAKTYYGECSDEHKQTMNAWAAVGVGNTAPNPCVPPPPPLNVYISGPDLIFEYDCPTWSANVSGGTGSYNYNWYLDDIWQTSSSSYFDCFPYPGYNVIRLEVISGSETSCAVLILYVEGDGGTPPMVPLSATTSILVFPNPATNNLTISVTADDQELDKMMQTRKYYLYIIDGQGKILGKKICNGNNMIFDVSNLIDGNYSITLVNKNHIISSAQIIVKH